MRPVIASRSIILGALLALGLGVAPAQASFLATESTSVIHLASGSYLYSYTVAVSASSTVSASEFDLGLGAPIDPTSIINPSNFFQFYSPGDPSISFTATASTTGFDGISPGSSGTFSFVSTFAPVMQAYQVGGLDPNFTFDSIQGMTLAPGIAVPEPSSLILTGLGVCGALGSLVRARRRSSGSLA